MSIAFTNKKEEEEETRFPYPWVPGLRATIPNNISVRCCLT